MSGRNLPKREIARLEVATKVGARTARIRSVDGQTVNGGAKYIAIEPGAHVFLVDFEEIIDPGRKWAFKIELLGKESDLIAPRDGSAISTTRPISVNGSVRGGKTYCVETSTLNFVPAPLSPSERTYPTLLGNDFQKRYVLQGSPVIREK